MANLISTQDAAKLSGYSEAWIKKLLQNGKLSGFKVGKRSWIIERESVKAYARSQKSKK